MEMSYKHLSAVIISFLLIFSAVGIIKNHNKDENIEYYDADITIAPSFYVNNESEKIMYNEEIYDNQCETYSLNIISNDLKASVSSAENSSITADENSETAPTVTTVKEVKTYVVSRSAKAYDKKSAYIDIRTVFQLPDLPVGCEVTSLAMVLNFLGFNADKNDLAKNYLPQSNFYFEANNAIYINNYNNFFFGDPFGNGYGCFSDCIVRTAQKYISQNGGGFTAKNISGSSLNELLTYVSKGTPVLCWGSVDMKVPFYTTKFRDIKTGEDIRWISGEHCFVLTGFSLEDKTVTINDPLRGIVSHDMSLFFTRYTQLKKNAVIITPNKKDTADTAVTTVTTDSKISVTQSTT